MNSKKRKKKSRRSTKKSQKISGKQALSLAVQLHQCGRLDEAETFYRKILEAIPDQPDALHFLGVLSHQTGKSEEAIILINKAIALNPDLPDMRNNLGNIFKERGRWEEASACYQKVISLKPDHADTHNNLGVMLKEQGKPEAAMTAYHRAIELDSHHLDAHINLGLILWEGGKLGEAAATYRKAIQLQPKRVKTYQCLGSVLKQQKKFEEAVAVYKKAMKLNAEAAETHFGLANTLHAQGLWEEAVKAYRETIQLKPNHAEAYENLIATLYCMKRSNEALACCQEWIERQPEHPVAKHMLAAHSGKDVPNRASDFYIKDTFENFADTFEGHLKDLDYRAPELIAAALKNEGVWPEKQFDILDAGCGTGLCGALLQPYARSLIGVDLSPAMLKRAESRNIYDKLVTAELTGFLSETKAAYDLIASADTFVYFGELEEVFKAVWAALRPQGRLIFTAEVAEPGTVGFHLNPHGRYSHTEEYLKSTLEEVGFILSSITSTILRKELKKPVKGWMVTAGKNL